MKMLTVALCFTLGSLFGASAFAERVFKWTVQSTNEHILKDAIYSKKPMIGRKGCSGESSAPPCTGFIYEENAKTDVPPQVVPVACKGVRSGGDKWSCPDAKSCYDDPDVAIAPLPKTPAKIGQAPDGGTGNGGAVLESGLRENQGD